MLSARTWHRLYAYLLASIGQQRPRIRDWLVDALADGPHRLNELLDEESPLFVLAPYINGSGTWLVVILRDAEDVGPIAGVHVARLGCTDDEIAAIRHLADTFDFVDLPEGWMPDHVPDEWHRPDDQGGDGA
jgi:hypothetical protein